MDREALGLLAASHGLDAATTLHGVSLGLQEANPVLSPLLVGSGIPFLVAKAGLVAVLFLFHHYLANRASTLGTIALIVGVGSGLAASINNVLVIS